MDYLVVCVTAFLISGITLFSGFGLGTVLMPAFAIFFPVPVAIAATAVVHLANNLFKLALVGRRASGPVIRRFGVPAVIAAFAGAGVLAVMAGDGALITYELAGRTFDVSLLELVIGVLIVAFAVLELLPGFSELALPPRYLPIGGLISGFFGGLSGHQGAFRAAFLIKAGLTKEQFIGTGIVVAVLVDFARLVVYGAAVESSAAAFEPGIRGLVVAATIAAFAGAFLANRLLEKVTMNAVRIIVAVLMIVVGAGLAAGWL